MEEVINPPIKTQRITLVWPDLLQRLLSLPILAAIGIYWIVQAQIEWYSQPVYSSNETFMKALKGMALVFAQGWMSRYQDWESPFDDSDAPKHLLNSRGWFLAVLGFCIGVLAAWQGIVHKDWISLPILGAWLLGLALMLAACLPSGYGHFLWKRLRRKKDVTRPAIEWRAFLPVLKWVIAFIGAWLCLYVTWRAVLLDMNAVRLIEIWTLGLALLIFGLVPTPDIRRWLSMVGRSLRENRREWLGVLVLTFLALAVRFAWLGSEPFIQSDDEAAFAIQAVDLAKVSKWLDNPFRYDSWQAHPMLFHMTQLAAIEVFGQTVMAARVPSALMGALTIPALYLMARRMFNWRVALASSVFLLTFPVHIHFSRIALNQPGDPFFATLTFAFLVRAVKTGDKMEYALAGLAMGLSQYYYGASRIIPLIVMAYLGWCALYNWKWFWQRGDSIFITAIIAGAVVLPNYYSTVKDVERPFAPRLDHVGIYRTGDIQAAATRDQLDQYWESQFIRSFGAYVHHVDKDLGFFGKYGPVTGWYGGIPLMIGVALCLRRIRDPRWFILPFWVAVATIFGAVMLIDPPHFTRYVCAMPAMSIIIGLALVYIVEKVQALPSLLGLDQKWPRWSNPRLQSAALVAFIAVLATANLLDYTFGYLPERVYFGPRTAHLNEVAWELNKLDLEHLNLYYLSSGTLNLQGSSLIRYQVPKRGKEYSPQIHHIDDFQPGDYAFVAAPEEYADLEALAEQLPPGVMRRYTSEITGEPLITILFVSIPAPAPS